ncbi:hypothetical protein [Halalkalibacterium halodurans]|uniref:Uncharacterized protein n=1 Tax=Halalkalibacterium halodurans TaxID=86665 RepID=A0A0M0KM32_ALKHA|nr:hypothetical protein [Halalkalibacterium halodurans]
MAKIKWKKQEAIEKEKLKRKQEREEAEKRATALDKAPENFEVLGQAKTDSDIVSMQQGQRITDLELRLLEMEAKL